MKYKLSLFALVNLYIGGVIGFSVPSLVNYFAPLTAVNLLLSGCILIYNHNKSDNKFFASVILISILGYIIEVLGVQTGIIFGEYTYGKNLGPKLLSVPPIIGINWFILVYTTNSLVRKFTTNNGWIALMASLLMISLDVVIEPFAIRYDLWNWVVSHVPIQNYIMWGVLGFFFHLLFNWLNKDYENKIAIPLLVLMTFFFIMVNLLS